MLKIWTVSYILLYYVYKSSHISLAVTFVLSCNFCYINYLASYVFVSEIHVTNIKFPISDFTLKEILSDPNEVKRLMQNLSVSPSGADGLLNTTVNTKEVQHLQTLKWSY